MYKEEVLDEIKRFIDSHIHKEIRLKDIARATCYSEEYISRFFKKMTGENLFDYIRNKRLLEAAENLRQEGGKIINVAFEYGFNSHEGFTRAFSSYFGISPSRFRQLKPEIKHYMPRGFKAFPLRSKENKLNNFIIFNQIIEKPERKLYFFPASKATHYFEYCEEVGCDIWGRLLEVKDSLSEPAGFWLPESLRPEGCSSYVQGVETAMSYTGRIPEGLETMILPAGKYMIFQSEPYEESDENMMEVIDSVQAAIKKYDPALYGYEWAEEEAPRFQPIPLGKRGYIEAVSVRKVR